jgi:hypothetical protein
MHPKNLRLAGLCQQLSNKKDRVSLLIGSSKHAGAQITSSQLSQALVFKLYNISQSMKRVEDLTFSNFINSVSLWRNAILYDSI